MLRSLETPELALPVSPQSARRPIARPARQTGQAPPLALREVTKRWRGGQPPVLDRVDLTLTAGTSTWIGGRNGVGKTTLLRIAAGLIHPQQGNVEACGADVHRDRERYQRLVSFLPAGDRGLYARLTVRRHLDFCARIAMLSPERIGPAVAETIAAFELDELAGRRVDRISMGQRQRLRIAMTLLPAPQLLLLDEPLTSLDEQGVVLLTQACARLRARGGAVLWCSPNVDHNQGRFDARWTLDAGRLVAA